MTFLGYKVEAIRPLNDARAVEIGANFLGEAILFSVAGSLIILENARSRMNARDRKNYIDDSIDNLMLATEELREELKELSVSSEKRIDELQNENQVLKKTLHEILDVSLRLRNHAPFTGQEIGIGDAAGGFVLQMAEDPRVRTPAHTPSSSVPSDTYAVQAAASNTAKPQSSYDFHHESHPQPQDDFVLIEQEASLPSQHIKKNRWGGIPIPWSSTGSSGSSSTSSS